MSSVLVSVAKGESKKANESAFKMRPVMQGNQGQAEREGAAQPVNPSM